MNNVSLREKFFRIFVNTKSNGVMYVGGNLIFYTFGIMLLLLVLSMFFIVDVRAEEEDYKNLFSRFGAIMILYGFITTFKNFGLWMKDETLTIREKQAKKHQDKLLSRIQIFRDIRLISITQAKTFDEEVNQSHKEIIEKYAKVQKLEDEEFKQKFIKLEIFLVILGTLIWAYGDLLVQLFR